MNWVEKGKAAVVIGGQFGSEGKGLAAAWLSTVSNGGHVDIATTNAGAQAGHTTKFRDGSGFVCFHLPTTGVMRNGTGTLSYINAGSIIDPDALHAEMRACNVSPDDVIIHPRAAVITDRNRQAERDPKSSTAKTASTQKGVGHAISDKIMRRAELAGDCSFLNGYQRRVIDLNDQLASKKAVVVEVPQGTDLSLNNGGFYPYTTSRDCWVASGLNDAGIHPHFLGEVAMVIRTFPIRVGNLFNEMNEQIGTSGPFYADSEELDWAKDFPGLEPERTTVTKRVRRIATWSDDQYAHGLRLNRPTIVFCNFLNYLKDASEFTKHMWRMEQVEEELGINPKHVYSFGPAVEDVVESLDAAVAWFDKRGF